MHETIFSLEKKSRSILLRKASPRIKYLSTLKDCVGNSLQINIQSQYHRDLMPSKAKHFLMSKTATSRGRSRPTPGRPVRYFRTVFTVKGLVLRPLNVPLLLRLPIGSTCQWLVAETVPPYFHS